MFTFFSVLCISTLLLISLFLLVLASPGPRKQACNRFLFVLLLINGALILNALFLMQGVYVPANHPLLFSGIQAAFFLLPPALFLYTATFVSNTTRVVFLHALPALLAWLLLAAFNFLPDGDGMGRTAYLVYFAALNLTFLIYYVRAWHTLPGRKQEQASRSSAPAYRWMLISLVLFGIHWSFSAASGATGLLRMGPVVSQWMEGFSIFSLLIFCCTATWMGARQLPALSTPGLTGKYAGSGMDGRQLQRLSNHLLALITREKPYLDPHLTSDKLAELVDVSPRQLSQVLNDGLGQHFFELINRYRIAEAKKLLAHPGHRDKTILEILYAAGFNSKSAFHRAFKAQTGLTPTAYRKLHDADRSSKKTSQFLHQDDN